MSGIRNSVLCSYCSKYKPFDQCRTLNQAQYDLMRLHHYYYRNDLFCVECIARMDVKLTKRQVKKIRKRNRSPHGTTADTEPTKDPETINEHNAAVLRDATNSARQNSQSTVQPSTSAAATAAVAQSSATNISGATAIVEQSSSTGSATTDENPLPASKKRRFAAKSTSKAGTSDLPRNTPGSSMPSQSNSGRVASPMPGPSGVQRQRNGDSDASSAADPPYGGPSSNPIHSSGSSRNVSMDSFSSAPMPTNRTTRSQEPRALSPPRPDESLERFRRRMSDAHRLFNRGNAG